MNFGNRAETSRHTLYFVLGWSLQQPIIRDILKVRKEQQGEAKVTKQSTELPQPFPDLARRLKPTMHPPAAQWKVASMTPAIERSPMQNYRRKWKKAVPGLDEFARCLQLPEGVWLKISGWC